MRIMRFRAALEGVPPKQTGTGVTALPQAFATDCAKAEEWGRDALKGIDPEENPEARVTVYETREVRVRTLRPERRKKKEAKK